MRKGSWAVGLALAGGAALAWWLLFPSEERVIRRLFADLAADANSAFAATGLARMTGAAGIAGYFTEDVRVEAAGVPPIVGRAALLAVAAHPAAERNLRVAFVDVQVTVAPDRRTASAYLTLQITGDEPGSGNRTIDARELEVTLQKSDGRWLIAAARTVDTLDRPAGVSLRLFPAGRAACPLAGCEEIGEFVLRQAQDERNITVRDEPVEPRTPS